MFLNLKFFIKNDKENLKTGGNAFKSDPYGGISSAGGNFGGFGSTTTKDKGYGDSY
jgi:hypothetical protein